MPTQSDQSDPDGPAGATPGYVWALKGARAAISIPAIILTAAFIGFAGLARESGISLGETLMMVGLVWALPSMVVLTGGMTSGLGLIPTAIAVALASVRLTPMSMALVPLLKEEGRTKRWHLFIASHFVAVTSWVYAMRHLPDLPRRGRLPFYIGFAAALLCFVFSMTGIAYLVVEHLPPLMSGALVLLTPVYFMCSLWGAARLIADKLALMIGLVLGPIFFLNLPGLDLLWTGLAGGTLAYAVSWFVRRVRP